MSPGAGVCTGNAQDAAWVKRNQPRVEKLMAKSSEQVAQMALAEQLQPIPKRGFVQRATNF